MAPRPAQVIGAPGVTYCLGILLNDGIILASGLPHARRCRQFFDLLQDDGVRARRRPSHRPLELRKSGGYPGRHQRPAAKRCAAKDSSPNVWTARAQDDVHDVAVASSAVDAMRDSRTPRRIAPEGQQSHVQCVVHSRRPKSRASRCASFRESHAEGNSHRGGARYALSPDRRGGSTAANRSSIASLTPTTSLADAMKCAIVSFDSTMRSNLSVGMPIDLACYERDSLALREYRCRFKTGGIRTSLQLSEQWSEGKTSRGVSTARSPECPRDPPEAARIDHFCQRGQAMQIRVGYELIYDCSQATAMNLMLNIHFTRVHDIVITGSVP